MWIRRQRRLPLRLPSPTLIKSFAAYLITQFACFFYWNHLQRQKFVMKMKMKKKTFHNSALAIVGTIAVEHAVWPQCTIYILLAILSFFSRSLAQSVWACNAIGNFLLKYIVLLCINLSNKWFICSTQNTAGDRSWGNSLDSHHFEFLLLVTPYNFRWI